MDAGRAIYGIDFSGAKDAGNRIWIAKGVPKGGGVLIVECFRAGDVVNSGEGTGSVFNVLVDLIERNPNAVFGFDFPFGLPTPLVEEESWEEFVLGFPKKYQRPEAFRAACRESNGGREMKRRTDSKARTPFSPYNLRLFKQTYYGISKVLSPLVRERSACVLPFQGPVAGKPWILEVCPASTLKRLMKNGVPLYKGHEEHKRKNRRQILGVVMEAGVVFAKNAALKDKIIADKGAGDALDSIIAALVAFKAVQNKDALIPKDDGSWKIEGYIYV